MVYCNLTLKLRYYGIGTNRVGSNSWNSLRQNNTMNCGSCFFGFILTVILLIYETEDIPKMF
jgi:hypothetical protein